MLYNIVWIGKAKDEHMAKPEEAEKFIQNFERILIDLKREWNEGPIDEGVRLKPGDAALIYRVLREAGIVR